jgi:hypothetical protein
MEWRNSLSTIYDSAMSLHRNDTTGATVVRGMPMITRTGAACAASSI